MTALTLNEVKNWDDTMLDKSDGNSVGSQEASRRESMASRSTPSEWNWSDVRSDEKVSPSTSSISGSLFKVTTTSN